MHCGRTFRARGGDSAFDAFRRTGGEALEAHATFEALSEHFRREGRWWLGDWPEPFRDARSPRCETSRPGMANASPSMPGCNGWRTRNSAAAAARAQASGMSIGLYRDLAVGADPGGSEIWAAPERFAAGFVGRRAARSARPPGAELGPAALRPARARRSQGLAAFRGTRRGRTCATPARSASTTPSSSSGSS